MTSSSIAFLVAYLSVAGLSAFLPLLESRFPRVGAVVQTLAAFGLDLPRLADGLRRLASGAAVVAAPAVPAQPAESPAPAVPAGLKGGAS